MYTLVAEPGQDVTDELKGALAQHSWVMLPAGTFLLSAPVPVPPGRRLTGAGAHLSTLRSADGAISQMLDAEGTEAVTVEDLHLEIAAVANYRTAIDAESAKDVTVRRCRITDENGGQPGWTTHAVAARNAERIRVQDCEIEAAQVKLGGPVGGVRDARVEGCTFTGSHNFAVSVVTKGDNLAEDVRIIGNRIDHPHSAGMMIGSDGDTDVGGRLHRVKIHDNTIVIRDHDNGYRANGMIVRYGRSMRDCTIVGNTVLYEGPNPYGGGRGIDVFCTNDDWQHEDYAGIQRLAVQANSVYGFDHHAVRILGRVENLTWAGNTSSGCRGCLLMARNGDITGALVGGSMTPSHPAYPSIDLYAETGNVSVALAGVHAPNGITTRAEEGFGVEVS